MAIEDSYLKRLPVKVTASRKKHFSSVCKDFAVQAKLLMFRAGNVFYFEINTQNNSRTDPLKKSPVVNDHREQHESGDGTFIVSVEELKQEIECIAIKLEACSAFLRAVLLRRHDAGFEITNPRPLPRYLCV